MYWDGTGSNATLLGYGLRVSTDTYDGRFFGFSAGVATLNGGVVFGTLGSMPHTWQVTVDGTQYVAYLDGFLHFDTTPFVAPPPTSTTPDNVTFSTPFTMNGRLRGATAPFGAGSVLFDVSLTGNGTASADVRPVGPNHYVTNGGVTYEFAAPTPEPATLLLMGTGLAGVLMRRRLSQRSSS